MLDSLDAVLDVGGVYNPSCDRYDHHQKGFDEVFGHGFGTKLSSAGLVYKVLDKMSYLNCPLYPGATYLLVKKKQKEGTVHIFCVVP